MQVPQEYGQTDESKTPKRGGLGIALAAAIGFIFLGFMLMGMPGMAVFYVGDIPFGGHMNPIRGDRYLEVGMWTNILWPLCFPIAHLLRNKVVSDASSPEGQPRKSWMRVVVTLVTYTLVMYAWAVLIATLLHSQVPTGN
jgi:hypothetical protein